MDVCMYLYTEKKEGNGNDLPPPLSSTGLGIQARSGPDVFGLFLVAIVVVVFLGTIVCHRLVSFSSPVFFMS